MSNSFKNAGIIGTGRYLPENTLNNFDFEKMVETSDEWIKSRTGIEERRIADKETANSDLATKAALNAIEDAGLTPQDIDLIMVTTVTPDMAFPSTACIVQKNIGATNAACFDMEAACTGFIYGITVAEQFIKTGFYKNVLVIGADTLSKITDYEDRNTCVLFGDGAGAAVVSEIEEGYGILSAYIAADGRDGDALTQPAGGSRIPASEGSVKDRLHFIKMDGEKVFRFATKIMGEAAEKALEKCGLTKENIDLLIPHQANIRIIDSATRRLKLSKDKVYVNIHKYGNMSSASMAVALDETHRDGTLKDGDIVVMVGFGAGMTWGALVLRWKNNRRQKND